LKFAKFLHHDLFPGAYYPLPTADAHKMKIDLPKLQAKKAKVKSSVVFVRKEKRGKKGRNNYFEDNGAVYGIRLEKNPFFGTKRSTLKCSIVLKKVEKKSIIYPYQLIIFLH